MSGSNSTKPRGWAYLRMSSKSQDGSIEQQRDEVRKLAAREGIELAAEYVDEGKSGSKDQGKRTGFHRMLSDARRAGPGEVDFILTWNTSRFGRQDTIDGAFAKSILREKGIRLWTVKDGLIDWNTFAGRLQDSIFSELNHLYSENLAADSLRGREKLLDAGFWPNGSAPYGYDRLYVSPSGEERLVKRTEPFCKPSKKWLLKLVANEAEAEVVRLIFSLFVLRDLSMRSVVAFLNGKGVPSPRACGKGTGKAWTIQQVGEVLTNPAYVGTGYLGARRKKKEQFCTAGGLTKAGVCPVIVEAGLWERAQRKREANRRTKRRCDRRGSALSGFVVCARCGRRMVASHWKGRVKYLCAADKLKKGAAACRQWAAYEDELLPLVCRKVVEAVDGEVLKAIQARPDAPARTGLEHLLGQAKAKEKEVEKAARNYLAADEDLRPELADLLRKAKGELAELRDRYQLLANQQDPAGLKHFVDWWQEVRPRLVWTGEQGHWRVGEGGELEPSAPAEADEEYLAIEGDGCSLLTTPGHLRSLLHRLGCKAVCTFAEAASKKKATPGRGRGPSYVLRRLKVSLNSNETEVRTNRR
jgi:site-specific DNA recombinase